MKTWWLGLMTRSRRGSATTGVGNSGYQSCGALFEVRVSERPGRSVMSSERASACAAASSRMAKAARNMTGGRGELAEGFGPGVVGVAAGQVGQGAAGREEPGGGAVPDGQVAEGLGGVALAYPGRAVQDDGLAGVQPPQGGQVADLGGGQLRAGGEVEALEGDLLVEPGLAEPPGDGGGLAAGDLVLPQDLDEPHVAEFPGPRP